jgi:hypothetical protein
MSYSSAFRLVVALAAVAVLAVAIMLALSAPAGAHRSWCHSRHYCPSDHATYRWRGLVCVSPSAEERTSRFRKRVRYHGRTWYCHR